MNETNILSIKWLNIVWESQIAPWNIRFHNVWTSHNVAGSKSGRESVNP